MAHIKDLTSGDKHRMPANTLVISPTAMKCFVDSPNECVELPHDSGNTYLGDVEINGLCYVPDPGQPDLPPGVVTWWLSERVR